MKSYLLTNKGVLTEERGVPTKAKKYEADEIEVYCQSGFKYYDCGNKNYVELDIDQLITNTITYTVESSFASEPLDFQYTDRYGNKIPHPIQGMNEYPESEEEEIVEEDIEQEVQDSGYDQQVYQFKDILDNHKVENLKTANDWITKLLDIYKGIEDEDIKIDLDYEVQERKKVYQTYLDHLDSRTKENLKIIQTQSTENMQARALKEEMQKLVERKKDIDRIQARTVWDLQRRLELTDQWLSDFEKLKQRNLEQEQGIYIQLERVLSKESSQVYKAIALEKWKG